ncbi:transposase domain-containing protein, partial [Escherichia coli]|nr:transposase domain-containing protein [Escherichia coli]
GTCRLNNVEPEKWLRYVIEHIQDWPANRVRDLLPWKVDLSSQCHERCNSDPHPTPEIRSRG